MKVEHDFPIDNCPICAQTLSYDDARAAYYCLVPDPKHWSNYSHYIVFQSTEEMTQSILLQGYLFETSSRESPDKTFVAHEEDGCDLFSLPRITDWSDPDKLINKVKTLMVFL